jgi:uncharacterized protein (TIGR02145 family)
MAVPKNRPKGIYKIQYPLPDIRMRFVNETNEGEIIFDQNKWVFDPPIEIGSIQVAEIEVWNPEKAYLAGNTYVSYVYPEIELLPQGSPFAVNYIYRCNANTLAGESPYTHSYKWIRMGALNQTVSSTIFITDVYGLEESLQNTVNINNLSDQFYVDPVSGNISLNIDYITVNNYTPAQNVLPEPEDPEEAGSGEIRLNNTIWKLNNEFWTDGGAGIEYPRISLTVDADPTVYGYLYSWAAVERLLAANPGYRLPTKADILDSFGDVYRAANSYVSGVDGKHVLTPDQSAWQPSPYPGWDSFISSITNSTGFNLMPSGIILYASLTREYTGTQHSVRYWMQNKSAFQGGMFNTEGESFMIIRPSDSLELLSNFPYYHYPVRLVKDI